MNILKANISTVDLINGDASMSRMLIHQMGKDLTIIKAAEAPKIFQLKKELGEENLLRLVCVVIKSFCESIKASKTMDAIDIIECAEDLMVTYTHDSVKDFIMALKNARKEGMKFYNCLSHGIVMGIISEYMDQKAAALEGVHRDTISKNDGSTRTEAYTLAMSSQNRYDKEKEIYEQKEAAQIRDEVKKLESIQKNIDKSLNSKIE